MKSPSNISDIVTEIQADESIAEIEGRASMRSLMGFIYSEWEWLCGESMDADKRLVEMGLLAPESARSENCRSWHTSQGIFVAQVLDFYTSKSI